MNLAKISANGQITVPAEIRKLLQVKSGDKLLFLQNEAGDIVVRNASEIAILQAQKAFTGVAEELGLETEEAVQRVVDEMRGKA